MASFKAEIGWKRLKRRKIKIIVSFRSNPTCNTKFKKNSKRIQKIKKIPLWIYFKPKYVGEGCEREKIKIFVLFRSFPLLNRKFKKSSKKIQKNKKTPLLLLSKPK